MREIKKGLDEVKKANPNLVEIAAKAVFQRSRRRRSVADPLPQASQITAAQKKRARAHEEARRRCASACRAC